MCWYSDSRKTIEKIFGNDADLFCDLLAAISPRKQVKVNWNLAKRIYQEYKNTGDFDDKGLLPCHILNVERALAREPLHGYKVPAFAANLKGDMNRVTIDMWILYYFGLQQSKIRRKEYYRMEAAIQKMARRRNMKPAEYQAKIWCIAVTRTGRTSVSYKDVA